jgi:serine/threonine-protein kinase RsbW
VSFHEDAAAGAAPHSDPVPGVVTLTIPCAPEYVGTARLTILGVAGRMGFAYDQIEDIRLAVGEACTNAIERITQGGGNTDGATLTIRSQVDTGRLTIEVEDRAGAPAGAADLEAPAGDIDGMNPQELGAVLMEILMDEVNVETLPEGGSRVRLVKYAAAES